MAERPRTVAGPGAPVPAVGLARPADAAHLHPRATPRRSADGTTDPSRRRRQVIQTEARRLERLVGDLLDLARLEANQFSLRPAAAGGRRGGDRHRGGLPTTRPSRSAWPRTSTTTRPTAGLGSTRTGWPRSSPTWSRTRLKFAATAVWVRTGRTDGGVAVAVVDDGPGIDACRPAPRVRTALRRSPPSPADRVGLRPRPGHRARAGRGDGRHGQRRVTRPARRPGTRLVVTLPLAESAPAVGGPEPGGRAIRRRRSPQPAAAGTKFGARRATVAERTAGGRADRVPPMVASAGTSTLRWTSQADRCPVSVERVAGHDPDLLAVHDDGSPAAVRRVGEPAQAPRDVAAAAVDAGHELLAGVAALGEAHRRLDDPLTQGGRDRVVVDLATPCRDAGADAHRLQPGTVHLLRVVERPPPADRRPSLAGRSPPTPSTPATGRRPPVRPRAPRRPGTRLLQRDRRPSFAAGSAAAGRPRRRRRRDRRRARTPRRRRGAHGPSRRPCPAATARTSTPSRRSRGRDVLADLPLQVVGGLAPGDGHHVALDRTHVHGHGHSLPPTTATPLLRRRR